mgnify:FL=1
MDQCIKDRCTLTKRLSKSLGWATVSRSGTMEQFMKVSGLTIRHQVAERFGMLRGTFMLVSFSKTRPTDSGSTLT